MAAWRRAIELSLGEADTAKLRSIAQSRTEPGVEPGWSGRGYCWPIEKTPRFCGRPGTRLHHQTVQRCVERAVAEGPLAALDDRLVPVESQRSLPRPRHGWCRWHAGRRRNLASPRTVDNAASGPPRSRAWTRGGTCVPRQPRPGHSVQDPRPGRGETAHKVRYYLEQRDPDFAEKMAEVLCVYRQVRIS